MDQSCEDMVINIADERKKFIEERAKNSIQDLRSVDDEADQKILNQLLSGFSFASQEDMQNFNIQLDLLFFNFYKIIDLENKRFHAQKPNEDYCLVLLNFLSTYGKIMFNFDLKQVPKQQRKNLPQILEELHKRKENQKTQLRKKKEESKKNSDFSL